MKNALLILCFSSLPIIANAGLFKITNRQFGNVPAAQQALIHALFDELELDVNSKLPNSEQGDYLTGVANSSIASVKTLGADYSRHPNIFVIGNGNGIGADLGDNSIGDILGSSLNPQEFRGFGIQQTVMVGINTRFFGLKKWSIIDFDKSVLYINAKSKESDDTNFSSNFSNFGIHLQFPLIAGDSYLYGLFKWGGVQITTGYEYTKMKLLFNVNVNESLVKNVPELGSDVTMAFGGDLNIGVETTNHSLPIEISTSLRTFYFLTFIAGLGADINSGNAKSIASFSGPVTVTETSGLLGTIAGTATLDLGDDTAPDTFNMRGFFGAQLNLYVLDIFLQANTSLTSGVNSIALGAKSNW